MTSTDCVTISPRLSEHLNRQPQNEIFVEEQHSEDKADWLADEFRCSTKELAAYCDFMRLSTPYSTQHGVKGEEYPNVLVVYDDVEAAWHNYSFTKLLTPETAGSPTPGQEERGRKLAYVSFSRATENFRILLFTLNPDAARDEIIRRGLLSDSQVTVVG